MTLEDDFRTAWRSLAPLGLDESTGGYRRFAWTDTDARLRSWFRDQAGQRDLTVDADRNGNLWAWQGAPGPGAVLTGSHLDSVPDGGAFDGPLGIVSSLLALDELGRRGAVPTRPIAVVLFGDEEGARFGVACAGSRLLTGALDPDRARALTDVDGVTMAQAMRAAGHDPDSLGPQLELVDGARAYVELHVEQGRTMADGGHPVGVATAIAPHGRWRFTFRGKANHAGTTRLEDRNDPMLPFAAMVLAARECADQADGVATVGRVLVEPNSRNAVPSTVTAWLDCRAPEAHAVRQAVSAIVARARAAADEQGVAIVSQLESWSDAVLFDEQLSLRMAALLGDAPRLPSAAGHDAGILAPYLPTAMLFVRNPDGVSHAPGESASVSDCLAGVVALADVLEELACR